jgi:hypothetical protein
MIIIGGILQINPFFVPPDEFLRELRARSRVARDRWRDQLEKRFQYEAPARRSCNQILP